jgi:hypothetical protein
MATCSALSKRTNRPEMPPNRCLVPTRETSARFLQRGTRAAQAQRYADGPNVVAASERVASASNAIE